jgi:hypothetical protein
MRLGKVKHFLFGVVFLLAIGGEWFIHATQISFNDGCKNQLLSETLSPDRVYRVIVFQRDCGATTGFSTQVSVLKIGAILPNESGNLFIADTNHGKAPRGIGGGPEVKISWVGSSSVHLTYHKDTRIFLANPHISGVSAVYNSLKS